MAQGTWRCSGESHAAGSWALQPTPGLFGAKHSPCDVQEQSSGLLTPSAGAQWHSAERAGTQGD